MKVSDPKFSLGLRDLNCEVEIFPAALRPITEKGIYPAKAATHSRVTLSQTDFWNKAKESKQ